MSEVRTRLQDRGRGPDEIGRVGLDPRRPEAAGVSASRSPAGSTFQIVTSCLWHPILAPPPNGGGAIGPPCFPGTRQVCPEQVCPESGLTTPAGPPASPRKLC